MQYKYMAHLIMLPLLETRYRCCGEAPYNRIQLDDSPISPSVGELVGFWAGDFPQYHVSRTSLWREQKHLERGCPPQSLRSCLESVREVEGDGASVNTLIENSHEPSKCESDSSSVFSDGSSPGQRWNAQSPDRSLPLWEPIGDWVPEPGSDLARSPILLSLALGSDDTVNSWELEYMPNPVIFAHLADCFDQSGNDEHPIRGPPQMHTLRGLEVISENAVLQNAKRKTGDSSDVVEPEEHVEAAAVDSSRVKRRAYSRELTKEPSTSLPGLFSSDGRGLLPQSHTSDSPSLVYTAQSSPAHTQPELEQFSSDQSQRTSPASTLNIDGSTPESSAPSDSDHSLMCNECALEFRTTGQRREHQNRKHIRRFKCEICSKAFHLRADLRRHERVVHKTDDMLGGHGEGALKCPNQGCKTATKVWDRKDNLARHVVRCRKALGNAT
jgi:hypothetical protein